jgi:Flp pilus assembly protein TadB
VTLLTWVIVIIVVAVVAAVVGMLVVRTLNRGTPRVPDALEHLPSRSGQPVAVSEGRAVTEAEEPAAEAKDDAAFERVLREELDEVRGEDQQA